MAAKFGRTNLRHPTLNESPYPPRRIPRCKHTLCDTVTRHCKRHSRRRHRKPTPRTSTRRPAALFQKQVFLEDRDCARPMLKSQAFVCTVRERVLEGPGFDTGCLPRLPRGSQGTRETASRSTKADPARGTQTNSQGRSWQMRGIPPAASRADLVAGNRAPGGKSKSVGAS
jgi:hypothetical protein